MTSSIIRFALAIIIASLAVSKSFQEENLNKVWEEYKVEFNRNYESHNEEIKRFELFLESKRMVDEHNRRYENGEVSFNIGLNHFSDRTPEEKMSYTSEFDPEALKSLDDIPVHKPANVADVPDEMDWRQKGVVTEVKNQNYCGSCYAFSSTGSIEGMHAIKTGKLLSLSEQQIVDCSSSYGPNKCNGGWPHDVFRYIKDEGGITTEQSYPYDGHEGRCRFKKSDPVVKITGYKRIDNKDELVLKEAVATAGPISIVIDADLDSFMHYKHGIYSDPDCQKNRHDHAVLVAGYGIENGQDYWLIKNSWGPKWGEQGYMKLARNHNNECGIGNYAVYPTV